MSDIEGKIAGVDCNAARVAGASTGSASDQGKVTRVGASEWSRQAARDIDGKTDRSNGAFWKSDIEGKAAMGSGERAGKRTSFKWAGAHESKLGGERVSKEEGRNRAVTSFVHSRVDRNPIYFPCLAAVC